MTGDHFISKESLPGEWRDAWTRDLAQPIETGPARASEAMLVFRLGTEHFAVAAGAAVEITPVPSIHRVPARPASIGLVNVRGRVTVCVGLQPFLAPPPSSEVTVPRLVVLRAGDWQFATVVDAVDGVDRFDPSELAAPPADGLRFVTGLWTRPRFSVACLDEKALFAAVKESLA